MPCHTNYMGMIFGGELMARMDIACAECVRLYMNSQFSQLYTVTVGVNNLQFLVGATVGDIIILDCNIVKFGYKSITVDIKGYRQSRGQPDLEKICTAEFTFVTKQQPFDKQACQHGFQQSSSTMQCDGNYKPRTIEEELKWDSLELSIEEIESIDKSIKKKN